MTDAPALKALIKQAERDTQAHLDEAQRARLHGNDHTERTHRTLAQVHHWFVVELKKVEAALAAEPVPAPAPPMIQAACPRCRAHEPEGGVVKTLEGWTCLLCGSHYPAPQMWQLMPAPPALTEKEQP